jgi:hypothetical protein
VSLAKKMFIPEGIQVPAIKLALDIDLGDIHPWSVDFAKAKDLVLEGKSPALFVFVENKAELEALIPQLKDIWEQRITFWVFYPKKPHLNTDLSRDATWQTLKPQGIQGTRQVGIDSLWSCMYFKNSSK